MQNFRKIDNKTIQNSLSLSLIKLGVSVRTINSLQDNGIDSLSKLVSLSDAELLGLRGLGKKGYCEIQDRLKLLASENTELQKDTVSSIGLGGDLLIGNIYVDKSMLDIRITDLSLSDRTCNVLVKSGVSKLGDLASYTFNDLRYSFEGMGNVGVVEIEQFLKNLSTSSPVEFHEFVLSNVKNKQLAIFDRYYCLSNFHEDSTLEVVAKEFGITRERVRQINKAVLVKVYKAIKSKIINSDIEDIIVNNINSPVQKLPELSEVYRKRAILKVYVDTKAFGINLYKNRLLKSEWVFDNKFNIDDQVNRAMEALRSQIAPVRISDLASSYSLTESLLYDMSNVTINDGFIVLNNNKRATGNDIAFEIKNYMDKTVRPVTISEVCNELGVSVNQARGLIYRIPGVVNVGLSTYALEKYGYSNKTIIKIVEDYLIEEGRPVHIQKIISYVKKYRLVKDDSVPIQLSAYSNIFTRLDGGYYALSQWGFEPTSLIRSTRLDVPAKVAILDVLSNSVEPMSPNDVLRSVINKYGNKSTNRVVTIHSTLMILHKKGIITRLGTEKSPFYIKNKD